MLGPGFVAVAVAAAACLAGAAAPFAGMGAGALAGAGAVLAGAPFAGGVLVHISRERRGMDSHFAAGGGGAPFAVGAGAAAVSVTQTRRSHTTHLWQGVQQQSHLPHHYWHPNRS